MHDESGSPEVSTDIAGTSTPNLRLESAEPSVVAVENGALVAKSAGTSAVLISTDDGSVVTLNIGGADLIVVDTFAQVTPGANENSGEDMGPVMARFDAVAQATGAAILVIHHNGKDQAKGARGWSGSYGRDSR